MNRCTLDLELDVVPGEPADFAPLAAHHYRAERPSAIKAVFLLKPRRYLAGFGRAPAGAIVYCMPNPRVELRNVALEGLFADLDRQTQLALINANVRCLARLVIHPCFRGIGLATRLVRETLERVEVPIVEALGVMCAAHPFLERAGMKGFTPRVSAEHVTFFEALSAVGIDAGGRAMHASPLRIDAEALQQRIDALSREQTLFLERAIGNVLKSHGTRRTMPPGLERTRYLLTRLTARPRYYLWRHPTRDVTWP
jgi:GNAT superfamily N-acetyltransferase